MTFEIRLLSPFGAEVTGLDIAKVGPVAAGILRRALADHGVLVIPGQPVTDARFVAFLQQLGPLTFTTGETPVVGEPRLNVVTNVGRKRPPRSVFHTDTSYVATPPAYTALRAIALPQTGGETLFASQYLAFETLPTAVKTALAGVKVRHVVSGLTLDEDAETECWHPLFRRHPISGRVALYLSTPERCQALSQFEPVVSQQAIRLLYKHSTRSYRIYRHRWRQDDIVIWDNRCTLHRADYSRVVGDRTLHRGMVAGEAPLPGFV